MIRLTVVTVAKNACAALQKTMQSVLEQDYGNLEYIVVDGQSTDGSVAHLKTCSDPRLSWTSEPDGGIFDAMNKGVRRATGQYCLFMNAGDTFVASDTLSRMMALAMDSEKKSTDSLKKSADSLKKSADRKNYPADSFCPSAVPSPDVLYGDVVKGGSVCPAGEPRNCHRMFYCHQSALVRTASLLDTPFDTSHPYSADIKQVKQLIKKGRRFLHLPLPVACFDTGGVSNVHRSRGLMDNMRVVCEVDSPADIIRFMPHLLLPWLVCKLRGK